MLQLPDKLSNEAFFCGPLQKKSFNDDCDRNHSQIVCLELILIQYFKKDKSTKIQRLYKGPADLNLLLGHSRRVCIIGQAASQLCTLVSHPVELATDIPTLWDVSRKFQKDVIYEQTATKQ